MVSNQGEKNQIMHFERNYLLYVHLESVITQPAEAITKYHKPNPSPQFYNMQKKRAKKKKKTFHNIINHSSKVKQHCLIKLQTFLAVK